MSGYVIWLWGARTRVLLEWCARLQGATARNTTEAEIVSGADCLCRAALPLQDFVEDVEERSVPLHCSVDNATALLDIQQGWSKALKYLRKHQRVSLGLMMETLELPGNSTSKENTEDNEADLLTKELGAVAHFRRCENLQLRARL